MAFMKGQIKVSVAKEGDVERSLSRFWKILAAWNN